MNPQYQKMMKQVQEMQRKMAQAQEELANETVEASAGGGMVTVVMSGALEVREVRIDPEAVDPDDVEMLQDLVMAATNEALRSAQDLAQRKLGGATGGLDLPHGALQPAKYSQARFRTMTGAPSLADDHSAKAWSRNPSCSGTDRA